MELKENETLFIECNNNLYVKPATQNLNLAECEIFITDLWPKTIFDTSLITHSTHNIEELKKNYEIIIGDFRKQSREFIFHFLEKLLNITIHNLFLIFEDTPVLELRNSDFTDYDFTQFLINEIQIYKFYTHEKISNPIPTYQIKSSAKKLNVTFVMPHRSLTGGMIQLYEHAKILQNQGHIISILIADRHDALPDWLENFTPNVLIYKQDDESVIQTILKTDTDIIYAGYYAQLEYLTNEKIPVFYWEQGNEQLFGDLRNNIEHEQWLRNNLQKNLQLPVYLAANSMYTAQVMRNKCGKEIPILPCTIDFNKWHRTNKDRLNSMPIILLVGNPILKFKDFEKALNTLKIVWNQGKTFKVVWICPTAPQFNETFPFEIELYVNPEQSKLPEIFSQANIFLSTSWYEGFSMPPLEAMATGVVVVTTNSGGINQFAIHRENCLLATDNTTQTLARYIMEILNSPCLAEKLINEGYKSAQLYDKLNITETLNTLLQSAVINFLDKKPTIAFYYHLIFLGGVEHAILQLIKKLHTDYEIIILYSDESSDKQMIEKLSAYAKVDLLNKNSKLRFDICICCVPVDIWFKEFVHANYYISWIHAMIFELYPNTQFKKTYIDMIDKFVCVSNAVKANITQKYPEIKNKTIVIENYIDKLDLVNKANLPAPNTIEINKNILNITTISRLSHEKGFDRIYEICNILEKRNIAYNWHVVGTSYDETVEMNIKNKFINHQNVLFHGFLANPFPILKVMNYLALLSDSEANPLVVTEALMLQVPCIVTDYDSVADKIHEGKNGVILSRINPDYEGLVDKILNPTYNVLSIDTENSLTQWRTFLKYKTFSTQQKILFMIGTLNSGGAEKLLVDLVKNLDLNKYEITVLLVDELGIPEYLDEVKKYAKLKYIYKRHYHSAEELHEINTIYGILGPKNQKSDEEFTHLVYENVLKNEKFDIEISYLEGETTRYIANSPNKKSKKIAWIHADFSKPGDHDYAVGGWDYKSKIYQTYDEIICVSKQVKEGFIARIGQNYPLKIIENSVDRGVIRHLASESIPDLVNPSTFTIVAVGRLVRLKCFDKLIQATKMLKNAGLHVQVLIMGQGDQHKILSEMIVHLDLALQVKLMGFVCNPYPYISRADLVVCPSVSEGYSLVLQEAISLKIPTLTTSGVALSNFIATNEIGMVVDTSIHDLYRGLKELIENPELIHKYRENLLSLPEVDSHCMKTQVENILSPQIVNYKFSFVTINPVSIMHLEDLYKSLEIQVYHDFEWIIVLDFVDVEIDDWVVRVQGCASFNVLYLNISTGKIMRDDLENLASELASGDVIQKYHSNIFSSKNSLALINDSVQNTNLEEFDIDYSSSFFTKIDYEVNASNLKNMLNQIEIHNRATIGIGTYIDGNLDIKAWDGCEDSHTRLTVGKFCSIAPGVKIYLGGNHRMDWVTTFPFPDYFKHHAHYTGHRTTNGDVIIGNDVWIAGDVTILSGVTIGDGAVIGNKSLVTKDIPPYAVVGGNPAQILKYRFDDDIIEKLLNIKWWDWELDLIDKSIPYMLNDKIEDFINFADEVKPVVIDNFVTIFTPTFNGSTTLERLFDSLKNQTYRNFEWIIVDDESSDNTAELISEFKHQKVFFDIVHLRVKNGGKHRALNKAAKIASGYLFVFLDHDDYFVEDALEQTVFYESSIPEDVKHQFAGVVGNRGHDKETLLGRSFSGEFLDATYLERPKYNIIGDKVEAFYTDVLRLFPQPEYDNEPWICDGVFLYTMAEAGFKVRFFNKIVTICKYLDTGVSHNLKKFMDLSPLGQKHLSSLWNRAFSNHYIKEVKLLFDDLINDDFEVSAEVKNYFLNPTHAHYIYHRCFIDNVDMPIKEMRKIANEVFGENF